MPSDPLASVPPAGSETSIERRLHPLSWLFVLINKLRPLLIPLLVLLFLGRGEWWELAGVLGAIALSIYSLIYSFGFRYRLGKDELLVREGIFNRTERHIPFARVQNIVQHRNLLHRLFGVTELRLESAGGSAAEAVMSVITAAEAQRVERLLRGLSLASEPATAAGSGAVESASAARTLHQANLAEILLLGLTSNRGAVLVGALFAFGWQFEFWENSSIRELFNPATALGGVFGAISNPVGTAFALLLTALAVAAALKLLSVVMSVLDFYGFVLDREQSRIGTESGLLTRRHANANLNKIQRIVIKQSWLGRRLRRCSLSCEVAASVQSEDLTLRHSLSLLVPLGPRESIEGVLAEVDPELDPWQLAWQPLHPRAWRRRLNPRLFLLGVLLLPAWLTLGHWAWPVWLLALTFATLEARGWARFAGYACNDSVFATRGGWLTRHWSVARLNKAQCVLLRQSPFDRRQCMAGVRLDTAGATLGVAHKVNYLDSDVAQQLFETLSRACDAAPSEDKFASDAAEPAMLSAQ